jgi:hypothetical protein
MNNIYERVFCTKITSNTYNLFLYFLPILIVYFALHHVETKGMLNRKRLPNFTDMSCHSHVLSSSYSIRYKVDGETCVISILRN